MCLVSTSLWEDPGFVLVEALFSNTIVISSDCPNGPREVLDNGEAGYLFKINSGIECYESHPQLAFTNWNEGGKKIDTDIQNDYEGLDLSQDEYIFIKNKIGRAHV